ncbi:MAG TPA: hypothetical protein VHL09_15090 [Dehalococcoidia bacterium]|nr:hypothetical protein [Dehalococcoidia bacterium]
MFVRQPRGWLRPDRNGLGPAALEKLQRKACIEVLLHSPPGTALDRALDRHRLAHPEAGCHAGFVVSPDISYYLLSHGDESIPLKFEYVELRRARLERVAFRFLERAHNDQVAKRLIRLAMEP